MMVRVVRVVRLDMALAEYGYCTASSISFADISAAASRTVSGEPDIRRMIPWVDQHVVVMDGIGRIALT